MRKSNYQRIILYLLFRYIFRIIKFMFKYALKNMRFHEIFRAVKFKCCGGIGRLHDFFKSTLDFYTYHELVLNVILIKM